ncbi:ABC transporter ATP-binding protein [Phaeodactylibacter xiamenensis]|uniref:ABC transporter ATP-binding protein n=1 Tax=Phaeodactylibacter xiamenensis TaxID=1524460 RepID=UPI0024A8E50E|nr:ATP-binding cassette domain-containing protein [Phaeodactylibacter xiamenensis]
MSRPILDIQNIVKAYEKHVAVNDVSFEVPAGSIFGLLGPNGAGKTSLIRIITTITRADEGTVFLDGEKLNSRHPEEIGYMPEERGLYRKMKVGEHLTYLARLKGLSATDAKAKISGWMEKFGIEDWWDKKVEELSKGMQQKIQFIATVVHEPKLLILDEPFSGLDPVNTNLIKDEIHSLRGKGMSIIFSTHRMEQVEEICEHIVLINKGENVLEGKVSAVKDRFKQNLFELEYEGELPEGLLERAKVIDQQPGRLTVQVAETTESNTLLRAMLDRGVFVKRFQEILPTLNEIFIRQVN